MQSYLNKSVIISKKALIDLYIRKTAVQTMVDEKIVDLIIKDQWKYANKALAVSNQVEITGLGMFKVTQNKVIKQIEQHNTYIRLFQLRLDDELKVEESAQNKEKIYRLTAKIASVNKSLDYIKSKLEDNGK